MDEALNKVAKYHESSDVKYIFFFNINRLHQLHNNLFKILDFLKRFFLKIN